MHHHRRTRPSRPFPTRWAGLRLLLCSSALAGFSAAPAAAQEPAPTIVLDTVVIQAGEEVWTAPIGGYVASTGFSATKSSAPIIETPQSISVVSATEIEDRDASTLTEALAYTPSLTSQPRSFSRTSSRFRIRGFDVGPGTGGIMRDGMRLEVNSYDGTQEPFGLERVEVVRGAASVLYGQLSPGGFVNAVSKRPTADPLHEIGVGIGLDARKEITADFSDALTDTLSYRLTVLGRDADTSIDFIDDDRLYAAPVLEWKPDEDTSLTLLGFYQTSRTRFAAPLPYEIIEGVGDGPFILDRETFIGEPSYDRMRSEMGAFGYEFTHRFENDIRVSAKTRYYESDLDWRYLQAQTSARDVATVARTGVLARRYSDRHDRSRGITHDMNAEVTAHTGPFVHSLLIGYDFQDTKYESANFRAAAPSIDLNDPVYGVAVDVDRTPSRNRGGKTETIQHGVYLQDRIEYGDHWNLLLGLRHDWADQRFAYSAFDVSFDQRVEDTTWRAGLVYEAQNGLAPYVSYSQSFFPVSVAEYAENIDFTPLTGEQFEAGIRYQPPGTNMLFSAAIYELTQDNVVSRNLAGDLTQIGRQRARGFEFEAKADLTDSLTLAASYSYTDARIVESDEASQIGQRSENTPFNLASLWFTYDASALGLDGLTVGTGARYQGSTRASGIDRDIPGHTLVDAMVRYEVNEDFGLSVNATNLFGKDYAYCEFSICRYGDEREVLVSARLRW